MSSRRQRPAVGGGSAEVVSIGAGGTRRPDYSRLASNQVAVGRRALGLSPSDFARYINERTGWDAMPETITAWEDSELPPGDVVVVCLEAAAGEVATMSSLLAGIPPGFPAEALAGPWVTSYQFTHAGEPRHHADIAHVTAGPGNRIRAVNHPPEPRSEGRGRAFRNEIDGLLTGRHVGGEWMNTSDTRYYGRFQLAVLPGETVMEGWFSGVGSDIEVSNGFWKWVRLDPGPVPAPSITLRNPHDLYDLVMSHSQYGAPLTLADVTEEP